MNLQRPRAGEFYNALYEKEIERGDYGSPVSFNFKATDDEQYKTRKQQYIQGKETDNSSFNIYTTENIDFQPDDRIYIQNMDRYFKIQEVRYMFNTGLNIVNSVFPTSNHNKGKWLKLGEY